MSERDQRQAEANLTVATARLAAAAEDWGAYLEGIGTGGNVRTALNMRSKLTDAAFAYHKAKKALNALIFAPSDGVTPPGAGVDDATGAEALGQRFAVFCSSCGAEVEIGAGKIRSMPRHRDARIRASVFGWISAEDCKASGMPVVML